MADDFNNLRQFSQELLNLGKAIEADLAKKQELENQVKGKDAEMRKIQQDIYVLKSELRKVEMDLSQLETKRGNIEAQGK
jgi:septal ring factor EnvC (AmiA/AmiB activator)